MRDFGENIGMAFQIRDDILDFTSRKSILGKPTGGDMKEKKMTLPLIFALQQAERKEAKKVWKTIKNGASGKEIEYVVDFVQSHGGITYAEQRAKEFGEEARRCLAPFPDSDAKQSLLAFINFVMEREK